MKRIPITLSASIIVWLFAASAAAAFAPEHPTDCTSFCLNNNGYAVFGSNHDGDWEEGYWYFNPRGLSKSLPDPRAVGDYAIWTARYASLTFTRTAYLFTWAGMNEAGLVISTMGLAETQVPPADERPPLDSGLWIQYMLDNCATLDEVVATDATVRMVYTVDHYLIADRFGNCAVIEFLGGLRVVHRGPSLPVAALSNTPYSICRQNWAWYQAGLPWNDQDISIVHFITAAARDHALQASSPAAAVDEAFGILASVGDAGTAQSFVFDAEFRRVYYRTHADPAIRWIDFAMFNPDCDAPVKMLDVNAPLEGDLSDDFMDFDYDLSLQFYQECVDYFHYPVVIPLDQIMTHFESFPCSQTPVETVFYGTHLTALEPWINRITVYNNGAEPESFTLSIFGPDGTSVHQADYAVPAYDSRCFVLTAWTGYTPAAGEVLLPPVEGIFTIRTSGRHLQPKLSFRYGASLSLAEFFLPDSLGREFLLPNPVLDHFAWTGVALMNPYDHAVRVNLEAYRDGALQQAANADISPRAKCVQLSEFLWPGLQYRDFDLVRIVSASDAIPPPMSITGDSAQDRHVFFNAAATPEAPLAAHRFYGVHLTSYPPWINRLVIFNNGAESADFVLTLYGPEGDVIHQETNSSPAHGIRTFIMSADPAYMPAEGEIVLPAVEGAFILETQSPKLRPLLSYRYGDSQSVAQFFLQETMADSYILPNTVLDHFSWTGVAVMNPGDASLPLVLEAFQGGNRIGMTQLEVPARVKYVRLSESLWDGLGYRDLSQIRVLSPGYLLPPPMIITGNAQQDRHVFFSAAPTPANRTAPEK
jgi:penicillin V acylase-like amidase (Ntn superfamily)